MSAKNYVTWAQFGLKVLTLLETLLPAFLVAWTAHLRGKVSRLEGNLSYAEHKANVLERRAKLKESYRGKSPKSIIDNFLKHRSDGSDPQK